MTWILGTALSAKALLAREALSNTTTPSVKDFYCLARNETHKRPITANATRLKMACVCVRI